MESVITQIERKLFFVHDFASIGNGEAKKALQRFQKSQFLAQINAFFVPK